MRRLIIILLTVVSLFILLSYFIVQTSFGARIISKQLSKLCPYTISFNRIHHSLSNFSELVFDDIVINNGQEDIIKASRLIVGIDKDDIWQLNHFNYIIIVNGVINEDKAVSHDISANTLKFVDSTLNLSINEGQDKLSLQKINGGIKPFTSSKKEKYQFDLTSQQILFNQIVIKSVLIQGIYQDGITSINNLGGNINNGFFVSKLKILDDDSFDIEQLKINNVHFQSSNEEDFNKLLAIFPKFVIQQFSMFESSIQVPTFSFNKGNIEATNISYDKQWHFDQSSFVFSADTATWYDDLFSSVLIRLKSNDQEIKIDKAMANWNQGNVNFTGSWQDNKLRIDQLTFAGTNYQLSKEFILPEIFSSIDIDKLTILPSILIGTNLDYPFVFTNFEVSGSNVSVVKNSKLGLYSGTLFLKAEKASINLIDIKYPDLVVKFDTNNCAILNFSTLVSSGGLVELVAILNPTQSEFISLKFNGYNATSLLLEKWKLVKNPPDGFNYHANLYGSISPYALSGTLSMGDNEYLITPQH